MASTIIPAGETRPVRIPKLSQIYIDEVPKGTKGRLELVYDTTLEVIIYPLSTNPHPVIYNIDGEICLIKNICKVKGSSVFITDVPYVGTTLKALMITTSKSISSGTNSKSKAK